jgi:hypothetical protein
VAELSAATMVLGNELRSNANKAESQTNFSLGNPSSDARATTGDLMVAALHAVPLWAPRTFYIYD